MVAPPSTSLQQTLQAVVQSVQWTYSLFWQLCPQRGILVWGDGYYNGAIKTRKTVQPVEVSTEEASLQRSQQLRELYDSLSSGEANLPARRPCAALSPEDLTEAEWFYLMCISFSFPPGVGLPGKALARQRHVWQMRANEVESKVFSRAILAKSAHIQTVVCIPLTDGVLELGNIEKVEEDIGLMQHAKRIFMDYLDIHPKPALSEHSTSNPFASADHHPLFQQQAIMQNMNMDIHASNQEEEDAHDHDDEDNDQNADYDDDEEDDEMDDSSRSGVKVIGYSSVDVSMPAAVEETIPAAEASELMQLEMSEDIRVGSISDCSNNLDMEQQIPAVCRNYDDGQPKNQRQDDFYKNWHFLLEDLGNGFQQYSLGTQVQEFSPEDAHYSQTVSTILRHNLKRWVDYSSSLSHLVHSDQKSAFSKWSSKRDHHLLVPSQGTSQWLLKHVMLNIRDLHCKFNDGVSSPKSRDGEGGNKFQKCAAQEEVSANHVLAERRRREKLNERFMILRSLVPFVTKMDKASILGDTIEYVKQLRRRIQDLEARNRQTQRDWRSNKASEVDKTNHSKHQSLRRSGSFNVLHSRFDDPKRHGLSDKRQQQQVLEGSHGLMANSNNIIEVPTTNVHVSTKDNDAFLELQCPCRDGLLLKVMQVLHELGLEVSSIQFSSANGVFSAAIHSKVKEVNGKRISISDVKKAIHQIIL